jgi:hypothetical protein
MSTTVAATAHGSPVAWWVTPVGQGAATVTVAEPYDGTKLEFPE